MTASGDAAPMPDRDGHGRPTCSGIASPVGIDGRLTACPECGGHHYTITAELPMRGELPPDRMWLVCDHCETAWWWHVTWGEVTGRNG